MWIYASLFATSISLSFYIAGAEAAPTPARCLFATNGALAAGAELRDRGVYTLKIVDVRTPMQFGDLSRDVQASVKDALVATRGTLKDFFNNQGMVEYYAAGSALGSASGAYVVITYAPKGNLRGRVYRRESGKYIPVVDVRNGFADRCRALY